MNYRIYKHLFSIFSITFKEFLEIIIMKISLSLLSFLSSMYLSCMTEKNSIMKRGTRRGRRSLSPLFSFLCLFHTTDFSSIACKISPSSDHSCDVFHLFLFFHALLSPLLPCLPSSLAHVCLRTWGKGGDLSPFPSLLLFPAHTWAHVGEGEISFPLSFLSRVTEIISIIRLLSLSRVTEIFHRV